MHSAATRLLTIALGLASLAAAGALTSATAAGSTTSQPAPRAATVATMTTRDFRVVVVARRLDGGATPTADVRIAAARRAGGGWRELGEQRVRGTYFWHTVTGPRAVCRFELGSAGSRPSVAVRLLVSPSLGCGPTTRFSLPSR